MSIIHWIFPRRCVLCNGHLSPSGNAMLCAACQSEVRRVYRQTETVSVQGADDAAAALIYTGRVRNALVRYKFQHYKSYARWFAAQAAPVLAQRLEAWQPDALTYVPTNWLSRHLRGYDQSGYLAKLIGKQLGLPVVSLLHKRMFARRQSKLSRAARRYNAEHAYVLRQGVEVTQRRIVLLDDVMTTGATMTICSQLLRQAGASAVFALAVTKTLEKQR